MRKFIFTYVIFLLSFSATAQNEHLGLHGLRDDRGDVFIKYRNYEVYISTLKGKITNTKTISKIIKRNQLGTIQANYLEQLFAFPQLEIRVIEATTIFSQRPNVLVSSACYSYQLNNNMVEYVLFNTLTQRDYIIEKEILTAYLRGELEPYIQTGNVANKTNFAGREVILGDKCRWMSPNNLHCEGGQISWSEFPTLLEAIMDMENNILANNNSDIEILLDEEINVIFEGVPTQARRIVYMTSERRYPLATYYLASEVRGRYVSCTLSNYVYNRNDYELLPLLKQFIDLDEIPENAINEFSTPRLETRLEGKESSGKYRNYSMSVRGGSIFPLGDTNNLYGLAPSFTFTLGAANPSGIGCDIYFSMAFPLEKKEFDYKLKQNEILRAKADLLVNIGLRFRMTKELGKHIYFTPYAGIGYHFLDTDQVKKYAQNKNDNNEYYSIGTLHTMLGAEIRYKKIGVFAEYHYRPYHFSKHGSRDLGNSSIGVGLSYSFHFF